MLFHVFWEVWLQRQCEGVWTERQVYTTCSGVGQAVDSQLLHAGVAFRLTLDLFNNILITGISRTEGAEPWITATYFSSPRVCKLRISLHISYVKLPFKGSILSTFRAFSGTLLTSAWIQFKSSPSADICACFCPVFSQAELHWLREGFCLSKNIRFDLSIAQWQLITAQNRFLSLFFFLSTIQKIFSLLQYVCCHWSSLLPKITEISCFFQSCFSIPSRTSTEFKS